MNSRCLYLAKKKSSTSRWKDFHTLESPAWLRRRLLGWFLAGLHRCCKWASVWILFFSPKHLCRWWWQPSNILSRLPVSFLLQLRKGCNPTGCELRVSMQHRTLQSLISLSNKIPGPAYLLNHSSPRSIFFGAPPTASSLFSRAALT